MTAFWIILVVLVVALFIALSWYLSAKRRKELAEWARRHGYTFSDAYDYDMENRYPDFAYLKTGHDRYAYNTTQGVFADRSFRAFDYHYETYSTNSKGRRTTHHHYFSAVVIETDLPLKPLFIRAEHFFDKVGEFLGFDDIDFESAEFSRAFCVKAPDRRWAFDALPQKTMEFLLEAPRFTLDLQRGYACAYRSCTLAPPDFEAALGVLVGVLERLPASVVRELKGESP